MLAIVTLNGHVFAAQHFDNPFTAIQWLVMQRMVRGEKHSYTIETLDGYLLHTL